MVNAVIWIIFMGLYLAVSTLFADTESNIRIIATNISSCCMCYAFNFISTNWVLKQYRIYNKSQGINIEGTKPYIVPERSVDPRNMMTLGQILSSKEGFDMFANHLVREFSTENLYFIFEMMQIKTLAVDNKYVMFLLKVYVHELVIYTSVSL